MDLLTCTQQSPLLQPPERLHLCLALSGAGDFALLHTWPLLAPLTCGLEEAGQQQPKEEGYRQRAETSDRHGALWGEEQVRAQQGGGI